MYIGQKKITDSHSNCYSLICSSSSVLHAPETAKDVERDGFKVKAAQQITSIGEYNYNTNFTNKNYKQQKIYIYSE